MLNKKNDNESLIWGNKLDIKFKHNISHEKNIKWEDTAYIGVAWL